MTVGDHHLCALLGRALEEPFACPVDVGGVSMSRATARALHTHLLRLRLAERRALGIPAPPRRGAFPYPHPTLAEVDAQEAA